MKLGQLIKHNKRNIFLQKSCRKWGRKTSSRPLFVFRKSFILRKRKRPAAWFHYISIALESTYNKKKLFRTLHYRSRYMFNFVFLDKDLGIVSWTYFVYDFSTKMFLMLYSMNWSNFFDCLALLLEILGNTCIAIVFWPGVTS